MDAVDRLIESEVERRAQAQFLYGVWIARIGWLRHEKTQRVFADKSLTVAQCAMQLYGSGAVVMPIDIPEPNGKAALELLEAQFLERQKQINEQRWTTRLRAWIKSIWRSLTLS